MHRRKGKGFCFELLYMALSYVTPFLLKPKQAAIVDKLVFKALSEYSAVRQVIMGFDTGTIIAPPPARSSSMKGRAVFMIMDFELLHTFRDVVIDGLS